MGESRIKIIATVNEINKHFKECPSEYFYIKSFNGEKNYNGNDNEIITFETLIRHNEIGNRTIERSSPYTISSLEEKMSKLVNEYKKEEALSKEDEEYPDI